MTDDAYPLERWASRLRQLPVKVEGALDHVIGAGNDIAERTVGDGVRIVRAAGGNHSVHAVHVGERTYCVKQPLPTHRHESNTDRVLLREVGGMFVVADNAPGRAPLPHHWHSSPAWLLCDWLPGHALGNRQLTDHQITELALATKDVSALTPENTGEPLWDIDWPIVALVEWQRERHQELLDRGDQASSEAASLVGDWLASDDPALFLEASDFLVFTRGDQNLANAMWDGDTIRFIDFEYCGWNDLPRDLSLLTEHIQSYMTPIDAWETYIDQFSLTKRQRQRTLAGRRRQALSWLTKECLNPGALHSWPAENRVELLLDRARHLCHMSPP